jgi:hypothetical protein
MASPAAPSQPGRRPTALHGQHFALCGVFLLAQALLLAFEGLVLQRARLRQADLLELRARPESLPRSGVAPSGRYGAGDLTADEPVTALLTLLGAGVIALAVIRRAAIDA